MNFQKRKQKILTAVEATGEADIKVLAAELGVSEITIRRDLNQLAADGLLYRTHGGATNVNPLNKPVDFISKAAQNASVKEQICREAAKQINDGDIIFMDCGSTVFHLCKFIKQKKIKVVTNSLPVTFELQGCAVSLNIVGGELDADRLAVHGTMAQEHIMRYHAAKAFLGVDGISENGLFANSEKEASITMAFAKNSSYTYILCDASKINRETYLKFAELSMVNAVVTDADGHKTDHLNKMGLAVIQAK